MSGLSLALTDNIRKALAASEPRCDLEALARAAMDRSSPPQPPNQRSHARPRVARFLAVERDRHLANELSRDPLARTLRKTSRAHMEWVLRKGNLCRRGWVHPGELGMHTVAESEGVVQLCAMTAPNTPTENLLSVDEAARLAGVSPGTIRNWLKSGALPAAADRESTLIEYAVFVECKVLRETELLALRAVKDAGVTDSDVARAIVQRVISPTRAPDRRFSISDGLALADWKPTSLRSAGTSSLRDEAFESTRDMTPESSAPLPVAWANDPSGRMEALLDYMCRHQDPAKLPPTFWDTRMAPEFIAPVGVFRAWYGATGALDVPGGPCRPVTAIATTEIWTVHDGKLVRRPPDDAFELIDAIPAKPGSEPPEYAASNLRYRELKRTWNETWHQRRRELRALGVDLGSLPEPLCFDGRNRASAIDRYRREHQSPSDLPDWFFDVPTCPEFIPPTGAVRLEYGEYEPDPHGGPGRTRVRHTAHWVQLLGEPKLTFVPAGSDHSHPGYFPEGSTPAEYAAINERYDLARQEWQNEYWYRQRLLGGASFGAKTRIPLDSAARHRRLRPTYRRISP